MELCLSPALPVPHADFLRVRRRFRGIVGDLCDRATAMGTAEAFRFLPDVSYREKGAHEAGAQGPVWTWAEVHARATGVAAELIATGIGRGDRVLLAWPTGLDFIAALLGCLWIGAVPVPVSPPRPRERFSRLAHIVADAGVSVILCAPGFRDTFADHDTPVITSAAADPARPCEARPVPPVQALPEDLALLQYTSGSTSAPKGVMITHGMLTANLEQIRLAFDFRATDRIAGWLPHYHDMGLIGGILTPVHLGVPNVMMSPAAFLRDPIRYLELAGRTGATILGGPNFSFDHCLRHASPEALRRVDLSRLRLAFSGAETIRADTLRRFQQAFAPCGFRPDHWVCCYGMAEATLCISVTPPGDGAVVLRLDAAALAQGRVVPGEGIELVDSGVPAEGLELAIADPETACRLPSDRVGEIWVRGPAIASGYWRQPGTGVFCQDLDGPEREGRGGWLRTGDLGVMRDGRLFVTGRLKELIVLRGRNHYPQDIEASVSTAHPDILPGRVAAFPTGKGDGGLGIVCELNRHACRDPQPEPIFAAIRRVLGEGHDLAADRIALIRPGALPVTPSGKIQRFACRDALVEGVVAQWSGNVAPVSEKPAGPAGDLARALRAAPSPLRRARLLAHLRQALHEAVGGGAEPVDDRRFFDMGLDSASGVALIGGLEHALNLPLDATLIYEHPTPAALANHLLARLFTPENQSSR